MPITGLEDTLKSQLISAIEAGIAAECGSAVMTPNCIAGLAKGIADAIIPFLTANLQVDSGQEVTIPSTASSGSPSSGSTSAPGTVS